MKLKSLLCGFVILLSACSGYNYNVSNQEQNANGETYGFSEFSDIPIPENSMMSLEKTEIYGKDENWIGKLVYESPYDSLGLYDFFKTELPKFNWVEITGTHGLSPVLVYGRYPRVLLVKIEPAGRFNGKSFVTMTMTPVPKRGDRKPRSNTTATQTMETMPVTQSSLFVSPDAQKQAAGSLGLGSASNMNYQSNSNGVGAPPKF